MTLLSQLLDCQKMRDLFYDIISMGLDTFFPQKAVKLHLQRQSMGYSLPLIDKRLLL